MTNHPINYNPWPGITSYEDPATSKNKLDFCGRDNDIYDMTRLIDDNLVVVLYGKSGIGKTSLLNAGVFPALRKEQYVPVSIRLGSLDESASFQNAITSTIENAIAAIGGIFKVVNIVEEKSGDQLQDSDYLWNYFARHRFFNSDGQTVFPVIVLDQFEEVLRYADKESQTKADALLTQIHYLADESHALNDCRIDGEKYYYDFNFRFVISIREDELYLLEDNIDNLSVGAFKRCRYRLRSLSREGALAAILIPGRDCIYESQKEAIAQQIIKLSTRKVNGEIDTLLLSLVCAGTYGKKAGEKITLTDLAVWKDNPMEVYYQDAINGLTADKVRYIQQHLIREDGSRRHVDVAEVEATLGESTYNALIQGENRMLTLSEHGQVELLHDQLALAVYEERKLFEEKKRKTKRRIRTALFGIGLIALLTSGYFYLQNQNLKQKKQDLLMLQSCAVAHRLINEGDSYTAQRILLEVLPKHVSPHRTSYSQEAKNLFRYAIFKNSAILEQGNYKDAVFSSDGKKIASITNNLIKIWNVENGQLLHVLGPIKDLGDNIVFDSDNNRVFFSKGTTVSLWDPLTDTIEEVLKHFSSEFTISPDYKKVVKGVNFVPDYTKLNEDTHYIEYWDIENQRLINTFTGHTSYVNTINFSPDSKCFITASNDSTAIVWDVEMEKPVHILKGFKHTVSSAAFSRNGKRIVTVSFDANIKVWDSKTGNMVFEKNEFRIKDAVYSPNGEKIIATTWDGSIIVLNAETGELMNKIESLSDKVLFNSINISPDGEKIVITSPSQLAILDLNSEESMSFIETNNIFSYMIWKKTIARSQRLIIAPLNDYSIKINNAEFPIMKTIEAHDDQINTILFSPDNKTIASLSIDGTIQIRDANTGTLIHTMISQNEIINAAFNIDGTKIVSISEESVVEIWNVNDGSIISSWNLDPNTFDFDCIDCSDFPPSIAFSPDEKQFLLITGQGERLAVSSFDAMSGKSLETKWTQKVEGNVTPLSISPDSKRIISMSVTKDDQPRFILWDTENCKPIDTQLDGIPIGKVSINNNTDFITINCINFVVVYSLSKRSIVFGVGNTFQEYQETILNTDKHIISSCSSSYDGQKIACGYSDGTIRIWDFPPLQELINQTRERFKDRPLTPEERRMYYLE